jgi:hypothetical protein
VCYPANSAALAQLFFALVRGSFEVCEVAL